MSLDNTIRLARCERSNCIKTPTSLCSLLLCSCLSITLVAVLFYYNIICWKNCVRRKISLYFYDTLREILNSFQKKYCKSYDLNNTDEEGNIEIAVRSYINTVGFFLSNITNFNFKSMNFTFLDLLSLFRQYIKKFRLNTFSKHKCVWYYFMFFFQNCQVCCQFIVLCTVAWYSNDLNNDSNFKSVR